MAGHPHDATGRKCSVCEKPFKSSDLTLRIRRKVHSSLIEQRLVCKDCHNDFWEQGEK